ncbi:MAG: hypothetical protein LCH87_14345 [Actinobacteria bacterium]|nr:hypothetical protein [Actinomycetota bacterium]
MRDDSFVLVTPRAHFPATLRRLVPPAMVVPAAILLGIFALGWFAVLTRPAEALSAIWWPASGLALGLAVRTPRRQLWLVSVAVALVLLGVNLVQYSSVTLGVAASVAAGVEVAIGAMILRAGGIESPGLASYADLAMLLLAVMAAATAYDVTIAATTLAIGDVPAAVAQLFSAGPRRAAGMLMVAPLFLRLPGVARGVRRTQLALQLLLALVVSVVVFMANHDLPVSFLVIVPPVWAALTLPFAGFWSRCSGSRQWRPTAARTAQVPFPSPASGRPSVGPSSRPSSWPWSRSCW